MKKGKIILSVALVLVMALSILPNAFEAAKAVIEHTVTFDGNGKGTENVEKKVKSGECAEWIEMKDDNYAFGGWYEEPE
ncbi:MAG: InlB B-repeat-containing protein, partial [Clostridia bacterium]|nr:InlB B-repeat-containing protein [Clostridia bacterium]